MLGIKIHDPTVAKKFYSLHCALSQLTVFLGDISVPTGIALLQIGIAVAMCATLLLLYPFTLPK